MMFIEEMREILTVTQTSPLSEFFLSTFNYGHFMTCFSLIFVKRQLTILPLRLSSFTEQVLTEYLSCVRHCCKHWAIEYGVVNNTEALHLRFSGVK